MNSEELREKLKESDYSKSQDAVDLIKSDYPARIRIDYLPYILYFCTKQQSHEAGDSE